MFNCCRLPLISAAFLAFSFSIGATSFLVKPEPVAAQQAQQKFLMSRLITGRVHLFNF